jgi:hypothetical protein
LVAQGYLILCTVWVALLRPALGAPDQAVVTAVQGSVSYSERGNLIGSQTGVKSWRLRKNQVVVPGSVIRSGRDGLVRLTLGENTLELTMFDYTVLGITGLTVNHMETNSVADISLKLASGVIQGELTNSFLSMCVVRTPNAVFVIPGTRKPKFQIMTNGEAHVMEGSLAAVYIDPATWEVSSYSLNRGQSFVPPINGGFGAHPIIRATREGDLYPRGP